MAQKSPTRKSAPDTAWLTGLRGIAALIVAFTHFFEGELNAGFRGYFADPPESNRYIFQLPLIRIVFSGQGMVVIFFVISAYSISVKPLRMRDNELREEFFDYLCSSTFRRGFRLYTPAFAMEAVSRMAMTLGLYNWESIDSQSRSVWKAITSQASYMLGALNPLVPPKVEPMNQQLWTIPLEFFGSCIVFLTILCTSSLRPWSRPLVTTVMGLLGLWNSSWLLFTYMCGLTICEVRTLMDRRGNSIPKLEKDSSRCSGISFVNGGLLLFGLYLLGLPEQPESNPFSGEYLWLRGMAGYESKIDDIDKLWDIAQLWRSLGGALCVFAISNSSTLQAPFTTAAAQYLGKISFGLYLVHIMVYQMWRDPILRFFGRKDRTSPAAAQWISWSGSGLIFTPVVLWAADFLTRTIDRHSIRFSRWVEKCL
ncbi:hypothetical protein BS50DRAFT_656067 [Corynespora cassiicola Philippines]|uniref:Acyltransferase 3 domain-containing protein n=1 Tax=Corynespora cassiicola Philippines TaxID=1448308 RepID=A0A2T2N3I4_CORCC|nr:hypothetical protein BS50DRAFT_656067 [Corynespora cassiicola Philippines]